jgi:hypothetical protein
MRREGSKPSSEQSDGPGPVRTMCEVRWRHASSSCVASIRVGPITLLNRLGRDGSNRCRLGAAIARSLSLQGLFVPKAQRWRINTSGAGSVTGSTSPDGWRRSRSADVSAPGFDGPGTEPAGQWRRPAGNRPASMPAFPGQPRVTRLEDSGG